MKLKTLGLVKEVSTLQTAQNQIEIGEEQIIMYPSATFCTFHHPEYTLVRKYHALTNGAMGSRTSAMHTGSWGPQRT